MKANLLDILSLSEFVKELIRKKYIRKEDRGVIAYLISLGKTKEEIIDICLS